MNSPITYDGEIQDVSLFVRLYADKAWHDLYDRKNRVSQIRKELERLEFDVFEDMSRRQDEIAQSGKENEVRE